MSSLFKFVYIMTPWQLLYREFLENNQSSLAHYVIHSQTSLPTAICLVHDYQYVP